MKITILSLFPEFYDSFLKTSIIKRAIDKNVVEIEIINYRNFTKDKYHRVDTPPFGGGAGLVLKCQPIVDALRSLPKDAHKVLLSPRGTTYNQAAAKRLAKLAHLVLIAGHYEGFDERIRGYADEEISIGDYILTGGEIASMAISDSIIRLLDGSIANESLMEESFNSNLLEYPQYTEPYEFEGKKVPDILFSGNHEAIRKYHLKESLKITKKYRPDLFDKLELTKEEKVLLKEIEEGNEEPSWYKNAIEKGRKFIK